jgi:hypothetical protein
MSRAYYAAFNELSEHLRAWSVVPPGGRSPHDAAWNVLRYGIADGDVRRQAARDAVADIGLRLKDQRQKADYRLTQVIGRNDAKQAVDTAERIIAELDRLDAARPAT